MARVGSQHHPAPARAHAYRLHALGVAADMMQLDARRDLRCAVVELHALVEYAAHQLHHVIRFVAMAHQPVAHATAGGEIHLLVLQVIARIGEQRNVARMVVVHMGDDHVLTFSGSMPMALRPSATGLTIWRLRFFAMASLKPVSTTMLRSLFEMIQT